jgi:aspartyl-tRNA(Asn)/glutamyl-tRNA(Gln) amidotransferase subunit C
MISTEEIKRIANLAKLELSAEEMANFAKQLSDILSYLDQIKVLDLENVPESLSGAEDIDHVLRTDQVVASDSKVLLQANNLADNQLLAPNVFNK